jgi:hypothetical protein
MACNRLALVALFPLVLSAQKITIEFDESRDFSDFKSFTLLNGRISSKNASLNNDLVQRKVETLIRKHLAERKLSEVASQPDLNIDWSLGSGKRTHVERYGAGWHGAHHVTYHYTEGTLVLNLRDAKKQELVWQATAVADKDAPAKIQEALDSMIRKAFEKFPPKKK